MNEYKIYSAVSYDPGAVEIYKTKSEEDLETTVRAAALMFLNEEFDKNEETIRNLDFNAVRIDGDVKLPMVVALIESESNGNYSVFIWGELMDHPVPNLDIDNDYVKLAKTDKGILRAKLLESGFDPIEE